MAMIIPEVFANAVNERLGVKLRAGRLATDFTDLVDDITTYGDTVHFPVIDRITDATVVTKGTPLTPDEVNMTDSTSEIKQVGNSVRIYDKDSVQVKGTLKDKLARQLGESMAKAVDSDIVNEIRTNAVYKDSVDTFTVSSIEDAFDVFGDDIDNDTFAGILINAKLRKSLMRMDEFTAVNKTYASNGNGVVVDGIIGHWNGTIPVYISNNGTFNNNKAMLAIVKKDAVGIIWQKVPTIEEEREAKLFATDIVANEMYATKLIRDDGVSVLEVSIGNATETPDEDDTDITEG